MRYDSEDRGDKEMRVLLIGALLILFVGGFFMVRLFFSDGEKKASDTISSNEEKNDHLSISPDIVRQKIINHEPIKFLDIRPAEAFAEKHIPGSVSVPISAIESYPAEANDILVIVYSASDLQSLEAAKNTVAHSSLTAFFLEGGFENWESNNNQTISVGDPRSFVDQSKVVFIGSGDVLKLIAAQNADIVLLDVQSKANYEKVHIKNAKNIPLDELEKRITEIPSNKNIIVYGENELASFRAGVRLNDLNIFTAKTLSGNLNLLKESNLPLEPEQK